MKNDIKKVIQTTYKDRVTYTVFTHNNKFIYESNIPEYIFCFMASCDKIKDTITNEGIYIVVYSR